MPCPQHPRGRDLFYQFQACAGPLPSPQARQALHAQAEDLLRQLALVLHLTRTVKESFTGGRGGVRTDRL